MNSDNWAEICFLLKENIKANISESDFENQVIQALRVLGWKVHLGDIQIRPSIPVGANNRAIPDFIIKSLEGKNVFVIEIKQPSLPITVQFQQQLFSYMRLLKLSYGVLIGSNIQIFYDGDLSDQDDPILLETIPFYKDNIKGEQFVELFSKDQFSQESLLAYTKKALKHISKAGEQKKLKLHILSVDFQKEVKTLIKQHLLSDYDAEVIDKTLTDIVVECKESVSSIIQSESQNEPTINKATVGDDSKTKKRDTTKYILNNYGRKLTKSRFVYEVVKQYIKNNPASSFDDLRGVFDKELQGSTGVVNTVDEIELKYANKTDKRHFIKEEDLLTSGDGIMFAVSTQWGIGNVGNIVSLARDLGYQVQDLE